LAISATSYSNETFNNEVIKQWMLIMQHSKHCSIIPLLLLLKQLRSKQTSDGENYVTELCLALKNDGKWGLLVITITM